MTYFDESCLASSCLQCIGNLSSMHWKQFNCRGTMHGMQFGTCLTLIDTFHCLDSGIITSSDQEKWRFLSCNGSKSDNAGPYLSCMHVCMHGCIHVCLTLCIYVWLYVCTISNMPLPVTTPLLAWTCPQWRGQHVDSSCMWWQLTSICRPYHALTWLSALTALIQ